MKVSKKSWHYKIRSKFDSKEKNVSLCKYFWQVVGSLLLYSLGVLITVALAPFAICCGAIPSRRFLIEWDHYEGLSLDKTGKHILYPAHVLFPPLMYLCHMFFRDHSGPESGLVILAGLFFMICGVVGGIALALLVITLFKTFVYWAVENVFKNLRPWLEKEEKKEPGLLSSYLTAKKQKVCPLIEFEE